MEQGGLQVISIRGGEARIARVLNEYGREGWRLVSVWSSWDYFKRLLASAT